MASHPHRAYSALSLQLEAITSSQSSVGHDVVPLQNLSYTAFIINSTTHTYTQVHKKQNKKKSCYKTPHPLTFTL